MNNVIAFPKPAEHPKARTASGKSVTLFMHVKCATLIVHLANSSAPAASGERIRRN